MRFEDWADEDLVRRIRQGDQAAARVLFDRHATLLRARARRRILGGLRRKLGESDLVQETYLVVLEDLDGFEDRGPGSFRRWLETVFRHKANDEVKRWVHAKKRSARREVSGSASAAGREPPDRGRSPSSQAALNEEDEALRRAIDAMSGDDRLVLELVHRQQKDFAEAGRALGRSAEAARKLYGRAVRRLTKSLRPTA